MADDLLSTSIRFNHGTNPGLFLAKVDIYRGLHSTQCSNHLSRFVRSSSSTTKASSNAVALSVLLSPALLIIDNIHFQYNGALYGLLILSLVLARKQETILASGLIFAALLCFKHIYLYLAPAYFVYLLRTYCLSSKSIFRVRLQNCIKLGVGLGIVLGAAFGPFLYWGQQDALLKRLFPFSRGLCHAYWAPNVWAMYSFTDRVLLTIAPYLGVNVDYGAAKSVTRGLVGDSTFSVLPNISPKACFILTLIFQIVRMIVSFD